MELGSGLHDLKGGIKSLVKKFQKEKFSTSTEKNIPFIGGYYQVDSSLSTDQP
jgi:hypothetical protein